MNGKSSWSIQSDGDLILPTPGEYTIIPTCSFYADVYMWGGGGGGAYSWFNSYTSEDTTPVRIGAKKGGGGGFVSGRVIMEVGKVYTAVKAGGGNLATSKVTNQDGDSGTPYGPGGDSLSGANGGDESKATQ